MFYLGDEIVEYEDKFQSPRRKLSLERPSGSSTPAIHPTDITQPSGTVLSTNIPVPPTDDDEVLLRGVAAKFYGVAELKPFQVSAVQAVFERKDVIVVQPTGSGKSLCFQLPSLVQKSTTVVVVPTVVLMINQVREMSSKGISCAMLGGGQDRIQNRLVETDALGGKFRFLYVTLEYLFSGKEKSSFLSSLENAGVLQLVAVDEAHCAITWSCFRFCYKELTALKGIIPQTPIMLLTATATAQHREELKSKFLGVGAEVVELLSSVDRPNIALSVQYISKTFHNTDFLLQTRDGVQMFTTEYETIRRNIGDKKAIVYVDSVKMVQNLFQLFTEQGLRCVAIYGQGQPSIEKDKNMAHWLRGEVQVVVATCAFGLGVSRPDIEVVIRLGLPGSVEELVQEIVRAGRNGCRAETFLFVSSVDLQISTPLFFLGNNRENRAEQAKLGEALAQSWSYSKTDRCLRGYILSHFGEGYKTCGELGGILCQNCRDMGVEQDCGEELHIILSCANDHKSPLGTRKLAWYIMGSTCAELSLVEKGELYGMGRSKKWSFDVWHDLIDLCVARGFLKKTFYVLPMASSMVAYFRLSVSADGFTCLAGGEPSFAVVNKILGTNREPAGRQNRFSEKLRALLKHENTWYEFSEGWEHQYPGILHGKNQEKLGFIPDVSLFPLYNPSQKDSWLLNEIQFGKKNINCRNMKAQVGSETIELGISRSYCAGVKVCAANGCYATHSFNARKNLCKDHPKRPLRKSADSHGPCPVTFLVAVPVSKEDNRAWILPFSSDAAVDVDHIFSMHDHPCPISIEIDGSVIPKDLRVPKKITTQIKEAVFKNPTLTAGDISRGVRLGYAPRAMTTALQNRNLSKIVSRTANAASGGPGGVDFVRDFNKIQQLSEKSSANFSSALKKESFLLAMFPYIRKFNFSDGSGGELDYVFTMSPIHSILGQLTQAPIRGRSGKKVAQNLHYVLSQIVTQRPHVRFAVSGIVPRPVDDGKLHKQANRMSFLSFFENNDVPYLFLSHRGLFEPCDYAADGLHFNYRGTAKLRQILYSLKF